MSVRQSIRPYASTIGGLFCPWVRARSPNWRLPRGAWHGAVPRQVAESLSGERPPVQSRWRLRPQHGRPGAAGPGAAHRDAGLEAGDP